MATLTRAYNSFNYGLLRGRFNVTSDTYKLALLSASYEPVTIASVRNSLFAYNLNDVVYNATYGKYYTVVQAGTTSSGTPTFTGTLNELITDGSVIWRCDGPTPPSDHDAWADVSAYEVTDVTYPVGGVALVSPAASILYGQGVLTATDIDVAVQAVTAKYVVIYKDATVDSVVKPLICYFAINDTGATSTVNSGFFRFRFGPEGILHLGV
jgi:hypothetical protein